MSRRHFDDYDAREWEEEHKRVVSKERRKRDAKKQRHQLDDADDAPTGRVRVPRPTH
ncbi:hypothetical protein ACLD02_14130 [Alloalcanivorax sp. C16-2]|uniref:hypothetical protein n=1 Tax=Alloalcanivorax TaxID=3020832 RepID=UPI001932B978|nr:hypothetical protein [Alloalcanivorax marinus]MBL7249102.1 hypothetical protein [Alloalcanivorax marinus]